jgi:hypothetical protein
MGAMYIEVASTPIPYVDPSFRRRRQQRMVT